MCRLGEPGICNRHPVETELVHHVANGSDLPDGEECLGYESFTVFQCGGELYAFSTGVVT